MDMKALTLLAIVLISSSITQGSLSDLITQTDIIPFGVIKSINNYSEGNSSLHIYVARFDFNGTSEEEMMIFYNETDIQMKFLHNFSIGEAKIFFVVDRGDGYHLVTNSSHPPYLENAHDNYVKLHSLLIEHIDLPAPDTEAPQKNENHLTPEVDAPLSDYYWYTSIALIVALIGFIYYIRKK